MASVQWPGAAPVGAAEEQDRLLPVLTALRADTDLPLTVSARRIVEEEPRLPSELDSELEGDLEASVTCPRPLGTPARVRAG